MPSALKTPDFEQNIKALQDEMKDGAQLRLLTGDSPRVGADRWNEHLTEFIDRGEGWHTAPWWVVENYMYKRLLEDSMPCLRMLDVALLALASVCLACCPSHAKLLKHCLG